jgi:hypothetical protein
MLHGNEKVGRHRPRIFEEQMPADPPHSEGVSTALAAFVVAMLISVAAICGPIIAAL